MYSGVGWKWQFAVFYSLIYTLTCMCMWSALSRHTHDMTMQNLIFVDSDIPFGVDKRESLYHKKGCFSGNGVKKWMKSWPTRLNIAPGILIHVISVHGDSKLIRWISLWRCVPPVDTKPKPCFSIVTFKSTFPSPHTNCTEEKTI